MLNTFWLFFRLIGSCIPMLVKSYIWGIKMAVPNRCIYTYIPNNRKKLVNLCHLATKIFEKNWKLLFSLCTFEEKCWRFWKFCQAFETLKLKKKKIPNSKPHTKWTKFSRFAYICWQFFCHKSLKYGLS
jgi:hypothetical protein